jgi:hypothetical protein
MSSTNNAYLKYGANYTTDSAINSIVVKDTNIVVYPGAVTKSLFGDEYLTPRYFSGMIEYNILNSSKDGVATTTTTTTTTTTDIPPTMNPTRRPRRRQRPTPIE